VVTHAINDRKLVESSYSKYMLVLYYTWAWRVNVITRMPKRLYTSTMLTPFGRLGNTDGRN